SVDRHRSFSPSCLPPPAPLPAALVESHYRNRNANRQICRILISTRPMETKTPSLSLRGGRFVRTRTGLLGLFTGGVGRRIRPGRFPVVLVGRRGGSRGRADGLFVLGLHLVAAANETGGRERQQAKNQCGRNQAFHRRLSPGMEYRRNPRPHVGT